MQASKRTGGWHWQPPEISLPTQHSTTSRTSGFTLALTAPPRTVRPGVKSGRDSSSSSSRQTTRQGRQIPRTNQRKERNPLPRARDGGMQTTSPRTRAPVRRLVGSRCMRPCAVRVVPATRSEPLAASGMGRPPAVGGLQAGGSRRRASRGGCRWKPRPAPPSPSRSRARGRPSVAARARRTKQIAHRASCRP